MRTRHGLIDWLESDLAPARRLAAADLVSTLWLAATWLFVVEATLWVAPLRPGAASQLVASPRFAFECLVGLGAGVSAICAALRLGLPRPTAWSSATVAALVLTALWVAAYVYGLRDPSLEPSMLGKRPGCALEVLAYGTPPLIAGLLLLRRRAALQRAWAGALVGAAAGAIPGLLMQLACMYAPDHILIYHLGPIALLAAVGAALGPLVLRRI